MSGALHEASAAYALDALEPNERQEFETHLATCRRCAAELDGFRRTAAALGEAELTAPPPELKAQVMTRLPVAPQASPPQQLKAEVIARLPVTPQAAPSSKGAGRARSLTPDRDAASAGPGDPTGRRRRGRRRAAPPLKLLLAAAAAIAVVAGVGAGRWAATRAADQARAGEQPSVAAADVLAAPDTVTTPLRGEGGNLRVVWSPGRDQVVVIGSGLGHPGEGRAFALWQQLADRVVPAGLFSPEGGEVEAVLDVPDLDGVGWGVTVEPDTGSPQPTSAAVFSGTNPGT